MLSELRDGSDTKPILAALGRWPVDRLAALGHELVASPRDWALSSALDHVFRLLSRTPSGAAAAADVAVGLPATEIRDVAALLARSQRTNALQQLLRQLPPGEQATELGACLLHEMIVRRKSVARVAATWERRLVGHPLADLPLHPLPGETRLGGPWPSKAEMITVPGAVPTVERQTTPPDVTAAVHTWLTESNGKAEAALFTLAEPLAAADVGIRTIEALELDSVAGGGLALRRAALDNVVTTLFLAAANGGAYSRRLGNAYGRAATWRSISALAGGWHVGCTWWTFDAANDWFRRVAWDLGVICLRPDGHVMAILSATDSD
ncbi:DUF6183 family protein [Actinophytocola sp.]|uniref:DUF6183 family protein n=1 Tax=Actinophytocola sp. TaxID=1872138 RepID=UPI002ED1DD18